jgi:hypothetical protein
MKEIDREIAEHIMGWYQDHTNPDNYGKWFEGGECTEFTGYYTFNWQPSTDIVRAMVVVNELLKRDLCVEIILTKDDKPEVTISYGWKHPKHPKGRCYDVGDANIAVIDADTLEMAVCLAALKVVGSKK